MPSSTPWGTGHSLPLTYEKVWRALKEAGAGRGTINTPSPRPPPIKGGGEEACFPMPSSTPWGYGSQPAADL